MSFSQPSSKWGAQGGSPFLQNKWGAGSSTAFTASKWGNTPNQAFTASKWGQQPYASLDQVLARYAPPPVMDPGQGPFAQGPVGAPPGNAWAAVNQWDPFVQQASAQTGIPGNVLKAIMMIESRGDPNARSDADYVGLMQIGPDSANAHMIDWSRAYDPAYNILMGAQELALKRNAARDFFGREPSWAEVAGFYFGWGGSDGNLRTEEYMASFEANMAQLNASLAGAGAGLGAGIGSGVTGTGDALSTMFGSFWAQNQHDFGAESSNGLYDYGRDLGLNGTQHTGEDIMMPLGSPVYAPADATVVCVGCWRNDHLTGGVGRIELEMPDGARILYDHSNQSLVGVGDTVRAGQQIGTSGGMYSPHIHLEVRIPDPSMPSGFRLVDPTAYFNGMAVAAPMPGMPGGYAPTMRSSIIDQFGW